MLLAGLPRVKVSRGTYASLSFPCSPRTAGEPYTLTCRWQRGQWPWAVGLWDTTVPCWLGHIYPAGGSSGGSCVFPPPLPGRLSAASRFQPAHSTSRRAPQPLYPSIHLEGTPTGAALGHVPRTPSSPGSTASGL